MDYFFENNKPLMDKAGTIKKSVCVVTPPSGCPMRCLEATKIKNYFLLNNYSIEESYENSDYTVFVTCSVSPLQMEYSLETIKKIKQYNSELIVMGCLPGACEQELKSIFDGKAIASKNISDIDHFFPDFRIKFHQVPDAHSYNIETYNPFADVKENVSFFKLLFKYGLSNSFFRRLHRAADFKKFIKDNKGFNTGDRCFIITCTGCTNNCSYCNIKPAIGKVKSKSIDALVSEYSELLNQGYRFFHFIADDLCSYGLDIKSSLIELLKNLSSADKGFHVKWSLHGLNPGWLVKNLEEVIPYCKSKKVWDITLAVESGSDRIIRLMNRHYKIKEVEKALKLLRKANPGLRIDALFFVGFPTETEEDFADTLNFIKNVKFDDARITHYTEFERVASAKIFPKVSDEVVKYRINKAEKILKKIKADSSFLFKLQQNK